MTSSVSRTEIIDRLRQELVARAAGDMSICRLAAQEGIFCHGFDRYTDEELRSRYGWLMRRNPKMSRGEIEEIADRWQMARQDVDGLPTSCDVQQRVHDTCSGWDDFTSEELSRFYSQLTGVSLVVK